MKFPEKVNKQKPPIKLIFIDTAKLRTDSTNAQKWMTLTYNPGHNILEICKVLVRVWFASSKMGLDIYYTDFVHQLFHTSVVKWLDTKHSRQLGNPWKRNQILVIDIMKSTQKKIWKLSGPVQPCLTPLPPVAATRGGLWKKVFLETSRNSQQNTCARVSFLTKLQALVFTGL